MGFRFFRRMKIAPGVTLNFSKSGLSTSLGPRGARVTLGRRGVRKTVGLPGTGLHYTELDGWKRRGKTARTTSEPPAPPSPRHRLDLGFFERLMTPSDERAFVDGCKAYVAGDVAGAADHLRQAVHMADGAFLAGFLAMDAKRLDEAERCLRLAAARHGMLGKHFDKYGLQVELAVPITETVLAHIRPSRRGVLLGLAEVYQATGRPADAMDCLKQLRREAPDDVVVRLSMAELALEAAPNDTRLAKEVVDLAGDVANESTVHAALMLYKARALRTLDLPVAARDVLTAAIRRKRGRPRDLLHALRYERARVYEDLGHTTRARREFEKLFADDPAYEDVAQRLGL